MLMSRCKSVDETLLCDHSNESHWAVLSCGTVYYAAHSLRRSLFRFLLAGESESQGEIARAHGARAKRGTEGRGSPSPLPLIFCHLCPRATLAYLKETEKTATQAMLYKVVLTFKSVNKTLVQVSENLSEKQPGSTACSRKYQYPSHRFFLVWAPPLPTLLSSNTFFKNIGV